MNKVLLPFLAFVAVMLIMLLLYGVWVYVFDRSNQARKKQRLQTIHNAVQPGGHNLDSVQASRQERALETWLRSRSRTFELLENLARQAHSPISAGRLVGIMLAFFTVVVVLGLLRQANPLLMLVLAVAIAGTPVLWLRRKASRRRQAFGDKLPEAIDYISRALRAGHSLSTAIGMLGKEFPDPIGHEFKAVSDEILFSIPFKDAMGQLADRVQSNDLNFFVISLMIQHETGGNLTELLDGLAKTMRERVKLRGKIRTLSSEGRVSALILGGMPFVLTGILLFINPVYISTLWTTPQGQNLISIGGGLMVVGFLLLNRIIQIKV
ncbi:MAG: type II secretion system F family protein [Chlorobiaceae bacterium]|nr:type II secretion system F family protein [Chlorobiaceae bacterium]